MSAACATRIPMIARPRSLRRLDRPYASTSRRPSRRTRSTTSSPGWTLVNERAKLPGRPDRLPPAPTITSPASSIAAAGASVATASTSAPRGVAATLKAGLFQRDGCGDLLRACHLAQAVQVPVLERRSGRNDLVRRHERRAVRPHERQQPLGPGRLANGDVDVVDRPPRRPACFSPSTFTLAATGWRDRDVQVVAGRQTPGQPDDTAATPATLQRRPSPVGAHSRRARSACRRRPATTVPLR